jgi:hypothetical protein
MANAISYIGASIGCVVGTPATIDAAGFAALSYAAIGTGEISSVEIADEPAKPADPEALSAAARQKRNALLAGCDWTQVADAPVDHAAWALYRQQLRDLPEQAGFPQAIAWPAEP